MGFVQLTPEKSGGPTLETLETFERDRSADSDRSILIHKVDFTRPTALLKESLIISAEAASSPTQNTRSLSDIYPQSQAPVPPPTVSVPVPKWQWVNTRTPWLITEHEQNNLPLPGQPWEVSGLRPRHRAARVAPRGGRAADAAAAGPPVRCGGRGQRGAGLCRSQALEAERAEVGGDGVGGGGLPVWNSDRPKASTFFETTPWGSWKMVIIFLAWRTPLTTPPKKTREKHRQTPWKPPDHAGGPASSRCALHWADRADLKDVTAVVAWQCRRGVGGTRRIPASEKTRMTGWSSVF